MSTQKANGKSCKSETEAAQLVSLFHKRLSSGVEVFALNDNLSR